MDAHSSPGNSRNSIFSPVSKGTSDRCRVSFRHIHVVLNLRNVDPESSLCGLVQDMSPSLHVSLYLLQNSASFNTVIFNNQWYHQHQYILTCSSNDRKACSECPLNSRWIIHTYIWFSKPDDIGPKEININLLLICNVIRERNDATSHLQRRIGHAIFDVSPLLVTYIPWKYLNANTVIVSRYRQFTIIK